MRGAASARAAARGRAPVALLARPPVTGFAARVGESDDLRLFTCEGARFQYDDGLQPSLWSSWCRVIRGVAAHSQTRSVATSEMRQRLLQHSSSVEHSSPSPRQVGVTLGEGVSSAIPPVPGLPWTTMSSPHAQTPNASVAARAMWANRRRVGRRLTKPRAITFSSHGNVGASPVSFAADCASGRPARHAEETTPALRRYCRVRVMRRANVGTATPPWRAPQERCRHIAERGRGRPERRATARDLHCQYRGNVSSSRPWHSHNRG